MTDPFAKHKTSKETEPAPSATPPDDCICPWHSSQPGMFARIGTDEDCPIHGQP